MKQLLLGPRMRFSAVSILIAAAIQLTALLPTHTQAETLSGMAGTWNFNTLSSGTGASRWSRGEITVADDGTYTASGTDNSGNILDFSGVFSISSDGLEMSGTGSSDTLYQTDSREELITCTQTESDGSVTLIVATKQAAACSQSNLTGTWQLNSLSSGSQNQWMRSTVTVNGNGTFTAPQVNSDGTKKTKTGDLSISSGGEVTVASCPLCSDSEQEIVMDSGKTLMVGTSTKSDGSTAQLQVFSKKAASYSAADLPGTWRMNTLVSGPTDESH
jgi:hypothetical protein